VPTEQVTPVRVPVLQVKVTLLVGMLLIGVKVSVDVPLAPGAIVKLVGETLSEKSGAAVVKLNTLDQSAFWPEGARACTSQ
jgi:hypothetical protein